VQDQWLNIFLLNKSEFSYYSILYFLSGFLFPIVIINNSLNNFFYYKFSSNKYKSGKLRSIGYLVTFTLLVLSILLIVMILLLINKTKRIIKRLFLLIFFIVFLTNWSTYYLNLQGIETFINKYISDNNYYDLNILNISYLFILEIFYYFWSFISYQNNLSNWSIKTPTGVDFMPLSKITIFYLGVLIYYLIFKRIS